MTPRRPGARTADEIRAECRESFIKMVNRPDLQDMWRQAVADPQRARRQYPHLLAGIRRYRPDLLPDEARVAPAARAGRSRTKR